MYWIVYLTLWSLAVISLLNSGLLLVWHIEFGGVEQFVVDKILRRYIEIGGKEPSVFDKILKGYIGVGRI